MTTQKFGLLRCPNCGAALAFQQYSSKGCPEGSLVCHSCKAEYPVIDGIPRFVKTDCYADNFSFEWKIHRKTQLDNGSKLNSKNNFFLRFGMPRSYFEGKRILDAGIGAGRYAQVALECGADVWGVDLSYSVDEARSNLKNYENLHILQADINGLPFAEGTFDIIYSFGVLHHAPDPKTAFINLSRYLKPGGLICISVYPDMGMYHHSRYLRKITTRLPRRFLYTVTTVMTLALYLPYRYMGFRHGILGKFAPISLSDSISEAILDTYDCYSPRYQHTFSHYEVFRWFKEIGLKNIEVRPQPVTLLGYK